MSWRNYEEFSMLAGKTLSAVIEGPARDTLTFRTTNGEVYQLFHEQDCCENVYLEDVCGDLNDLVGSPILMAEEVIEDGEPLNEYDESYSWTFYKLATVKGYVTLRWYGTSNGYYSESVQFLRLDDEVEAA